MPETASGSAKSFPPLPRSVLGARRFVCSVVADRKVDQDDIALLTSEIATNAVRHAKSQFLVRVHHRAGIIRVEVVNDAPDLLLIKKHPSQEGGSGLHILDQLASDWGVESDADHKTVWFEIREVPT
jgi:anti-sigma regulatory factor (Ser/Thr protein kinase)